MRFAALQSEAGQALLVKSGRSADDISSIVLVEEDRAHIKSDAVVQIAAKLKMPFPVLVPFATFFPQPFLNGVYDFVADNRYRLLGQEDSCRLSDPSFDSRFLQ